MKVRITGDRVEAIGKMLPAYDAFDVGAFVCSAAVLDALGASADADALAARPLPLCDKRPLYPGFRGYTAFLGSAEKG